MNKVVRIINGKQLMYYEYTQEELHEISSCNFDPAYHLEKECIDEDMIQEGD